MFTRAHQKDEHGLKITFVLEDLADDLDTYQSLLQFLSLEFNKRSSGSLFVLLQ